MLTLLPQDIARATFCRLTEDIHALKARYQEQHRLNDLKVLTNINPAVAESVQHSTLVRSNAYKSH